MKSMQCRHPVLRYAVPCCAILNAVYTVMLQSRARSHHILYLGWILLVQKGIKLGSLGIYAQFKGMPAQATHTGA